MTSNSYLYLLLAECPGCLSVVNLVEGRDDPVGLMQSVEIVSTDHCPACGNSITVDGWDVHEEAYIQRAQDPTEVADAE